MKRITKIQTYLLIAGAVALGLTVLAEESAREPKKHGTDILHLSIQKRMANTGVIANAGGQVKLQWHEQGKANHQGLNVKLTGLEPGAAYSLALNGNVAGSDSADAKGRVSLRAELDNPADVLALSSAALLDAGTNTVVSTTLP